MTNISQNVSPSENKTTDLQHQHNLVKFSYLIKA